MKAVFRSNLFALLLVTFQLFVGLFIAGPMGEVLGFERSLLLDEYLFLLIPALGFILLNGESVKKVLRLNKLPLMDLLIVILIAFLAQPVAAFLSFVTALFFENPVQEAFTKLSSTPYSLIIFMIAVTPSICEEVVARGVFLNGYNKQSMLKAALTNGLFFAILHMHPQQFLYTFALGVLFAFMVRITNSILSSAVCHFIFNSIQVTMAKFIGNATDNAEAPSINSYETIIALGILMVIAISSASIIVLLLKYLHNRHKLKDKAIENDEGQRHLYMEDYAMTNIWVYAPLGLLVLLFVALMFVLY